MAGKKRGTKVKRRGKKLKGKAPQFAAIARANADFMNPNHVPILSSMKFDPNTGERIKWTESSLNVARQLERMAVRGEK